jgi:hypothetical protein
MSAESIAKALAQPAQVVQSGNAAVAAAVPRPEDHRPLRADPRDQRASRDGQRHERNDADAEQQSRLGCRPGVTNEGSASTVTDEPIDDSNSPATIARIGAEAEPSARIATHT